MNKFYFSDEEETTKCSVCGWALPAESNYCKHCGWLQHSRPSDPDEIYWDGNFVTLNKARQLYAAGKPIQPDFGDFIKCMHVYGELELFYRGKHYGLLHIAENEWHFYEWNVMDRGYQIYGSIEEFAEKANIDGVLLKDLWDEVYDVGTAS